MMGLVETRANVLITPGALSSAQDHAVAEWPRESVGVVSGMVYCPLRNVSRRPRVAWAVESGSLEGVDAVVHSHPSGQTWPSRADMKSQAAAGVPFGVVPVVTTGMQPALRCLAPFWWPDTERPYLGRPYRHGVTDCLTLIRDWYARERGVEVPPIAYDYRWDASAPELDLYVSWRRRLGWRQVEPAAAEPGDLVLLAMAGARVANHGGVLLEGGLLLHHPSMRPHDPTSLSRRTPAGRLARHVVEVARPPETEA